MAIFAGDHPERERIVTIQTGLKLDMEIIQCRDPGFTDGVKLGEIHGFAPSTGRGNSSLKRPYGNLSASSW